MNRNTATVRLNFIEGSKRFKCKFIEPGLVFYASTGTELLRKETIDRSLDSFKNKPLTIGHLSEVVHGVIDNVYYSAEDGWYYAEGVVHSKEAQDLIARGDFVSCGYRVTSLGDGGVYHNIKYTGEITGLEFLHMALVDNPRYEGATIRFNSLMNPIKWLKQIITRDNTAEVVETPTAVNADSEIEVNGKAVRLSELIEAHARLNAAPDKANEAEAPKAEDKPADKANEAEAPKAEDKPADKANESEAPKAEDTPADKANESDPAEKRDNAAEREHSENVIGKTAFKILHNARDNHSNQISVSDSDADLSGFDLGKKFY